MYLEASFSVCILLSLSEGKVGMILRKAENASLSDCVLCRSRTLAITRCVCSSSKDWGLLLLLLDFFPLFPRVELSKSSPFFLLDRLFLPHLFGGLSGSASLLLRLSAGDTGELEESRAGSSGISFKSAESAWSKTLFPHEGEIQFQACVACSLGNNKVSGIPSNFELSWKEKVGELL